MNKQEAIEKIEGSLMYEITRHIGKAVNIYDVIDIVKQIDELEKPVVPQFVADWYEEHKDKFDYSVQCLCVQGRKPARQIDIWFDNDDNKPIVTLVKMKLFGYEVEKEKLYTVEIPIANSPLGYHYVLRKTISGEIIIDSFFTNNWVNYDYCQLTESEIKKDHEWALKYAKEVEECNQEH